MKTYITAESLRIIGKGWQVRSHLKRLSRHPLSLKQYLERVGSPSSQQGSNGLHHR